MTITIDTRRTFDDLVNVVPFIPFAKKTLMTVKARTSASLETLLEVYDAFTSAPDQRSTATSDCYWSLVQIPEEPRSADATATQRTATAGIEPPRELLSVEPLSALRAAFVRAICALAKVRIASRERDAYQLVSELIAHRGQIDTLEHEGLQLSLAQYLANPVAPHRRAVLACMCDSEFEVTLTEFQRTLGRLLVSAELGRYAAMVLVSAGATAEEYLKSVLNGVPAESRDRIVSLVDFLQISNRD